MQHTPYETDRCHVDDIPPEIAALIPRIDLACIANADGYIDRGTLHHLEAYAYEDLAIDTAESPQWVQAAIEANPGTWTARLCRAMHGRRETNADIAHCGLCVTYASQRKRKRAASLPPTLPGFEEIGGAYQLHPPCTQRGLTWLRKLIYRLRDRGQVDTRRERIPDIRQPRGWDWATRIYPGK